MASNQPEVGRRTGGERLPIKLILPDQGISRPVIGGGSPPVPFREVNAEFRSSLESQVQAIRDGLTPHLERFEVAPVRVQLIGKALAKSHRPEQLFSDRTCPIIGAGAPGELYLRASIRGLSALQEAIRDGESERLIKELSTVRSIEPVTPNLRRRRRTSEEILTASPRHGTREFVTRVRLFDFGDADGQDRGRRELEEFCRQRDIWLSAAGYRAQSRIFAVRCREVRDVEGLSELISVRSVAGMPLLRLVRPQTSNPGELPTDLPTAEEVEGDYPTVVVVDSGVSSAVAALETWVTGRTSAVAPPYRNESHGTFVAGLIVWGDRLNPHLPMICAAPCGVFDLQVIPNWDPAIGDTDALTEQQLLQTLEEALKQYANQFKVWNLSLGSNEVCAEDEFSAFAEAIDDLQERFAVSFVVSAGNVETRPLLEYPRVGAQVSAGRITAPSDTVLGITVGAVSHIAYQADGPKFGEPSPFSRHGAGPNWIVKPDLIHFGGTCNTMATHVSGVRSVTVGGTAEDIGTSFSAPLVARSLAQIYHQIAPTPSPVLARALLTHHARDPRGGGRVPDGEENYLGFGLPSPPPYCLECTPYQSTLVFEDALRPGFFLEWDDFPYPPSLRRADKFFGQIAMTIAFAPARGARWGSEYCETHIDAHFGVYQAHRRRKDGAVTERFKGLVPAEHSNPGRLFEEVQVRELRKWAPVRTYFRDLGDGVRGLRWRLMVKLLTRHGVEDREAAQSQPFALIVTISDPEERAPVYDEMSQLVRNTYRADNLAVRAAARVRAR